jgi:hypothetical protein
MGSENAAAQNNKKCSNNFKHGRILRNRSIKGWTTLYSQEIRFSGRNFSSHDDFAQHVPPGRWNSGMTDLSAVCGACRSKQNKTAIARDRNPMQAQFARRPFWHAKGKEIEWVC